MSRENESKEIVKLINFWKKDQPLTVIVPFEFQIVLFVVFITLQSILAAN